MTRIQNMKPLQNPRDLGGPPSENGKQPALFPGIPDRKLDFALYPFRLHRIRGQDDNDCIRHFQCIPDLSRPVVPGENLALGVPDMKALTNKLIPKSPCQPFV